MMDIAESKSALKVSRELNAELRRTTGWQIESVFLNGTTGAMTVRVSRIDGPKKRLVTTRRSSWTSRVVQVREVGELKAGMYADYWDFSESILLGRRTYTGIGAAMRGLFRYIDDNRAKGLLGSSRRVAGQLAVESRRLEAECSKRCDR